MWTELGIKAIGKPRLSPQGIVYAIQDRENAGGASHIVLAILPSIEEAKTLFFFNSLMLSISPLSLNLDIGDERLVWSTGKQRGGTLSFRRDNLVVSFPWSGGIESATAFAQKLDGLLQEHKEFPDKGHFNPIPRVQGLPQKKEAKPRETLEFSFKVEGLGKNPNIEAYCPDNMHLKLMKETFSFSVRVPPQSGDYRVSVVGGNEKNLFVKHDLIISVPLNTK